MIGPGRPLDTDRYFVICANVRRRLHGHHRARLDRSGHRQALGPDLPGDHHRRHGPRPGACCSMRSASRPCSPWSAGRWAACRCCSGRPTIPQRLFSAVRIAAAARHSAQNIAFHEVGRQAMMADPDWRGGDYWRQGVRPEKGLGVARMAAHITYLSEDGPAAQIRPRTAGATASRGASTPTSRWRATCATRALRSSTASTPTPTSTSPAPWTISTWPRARRHPGRGLPRARDVRFCVLSFTSDWLFPTPESRAIVRALNAAGGQRRASSRSRATRATTPSCSTSRCCTPRWPASSTPPARPGA